MRTPVLLGKRFPKPPCYDHLANLPCKTVKFLDPRFFIAGRSPFFFISYSFIVFSIIPSSSLPTRFTMISGSSFMPRLTQFTSVPTNT